MNNISSLVSQRPHASPISRQPGRMVPAPSHVLRAKQASSSPGYHKFLPVWQMAVLLRIKVIQNHTPCFFFFSLLIYLFKSPLQTPLQAGECWLQCCLSSRGADMSVGLMFRAVKSIRCDACRLFFILRFNVLQIIILLTLAIWLWGDWLRCCFKKLRIPCLTLRRVWVWHTHKKSFCKLIKLSFVKNIYIYFFFLRQQQGQKQNGQNLCSGTTYMRYDYTDKDRDCLSEWGPFVLLF